MLVMLLTRSPRRFAPRDDDRGTHHDDRGTHHYEASPPNRVIAKPEGLWQSPLYRRPQGQITTPAAQVRDDDCGRLIVIAKPTGLRQSLPSRGDPNFPHCHP